jgi:hypothetical protein
MLGVSTVQEIEQAVSNLSPENLAKFREWFAEFDAELWDEQMERDAALGKLDALANAAIAELEAGRCRDL